ncbi:MAG: hypothetical protein LBH19_04835 [Dysgonamonadaceae bacterium]|jgi:hypothetical protein|nr:hypothetical protein [Dysgonamonadaceae bacterium]
MKKIAFLFGIFLLCQWIYAQNRYKVEYNLRFISDMHMECDTYADVTLTFVDGSTATRRYSVPGEKGKKVEYKCSDSFYVTKTIKSLNCVGHHRDDPDFAWRPCYEHCSRSTGGTFYDSDYPCIERRYYRFFNDDVNGGSYIDVKVTPVAPSITYGTNGLLMEGDRKLPDTKKIRLTATSDYHRSIYTWKYSISGGSESFLPYQFQGLSSIELCGNDLMSNFYQLVGSKNVQIWLDYGCGQSSKIVLSPAVCAPEIVSAEGLGYACTEETGKIRVTYSRDLYPNETVNFWVKKEGASDDWYVYPAHALETGAGNQRTVIFPKLEEAGGFVNRLDPAVYQVKIISYYPNLSVPSYVDDSEAFVRKGVVVNPPQKVYFGAISATPVTCVGGSDGMVTVHASGGAGKFILTLYSDYADDPVAVSEPFQGQVTIEGLSAGDYELYLSDIIGCEAEGGFQIAIVEEPDEIFEIEDLRTEQATLDEDHHEEGNGSMTVTVTEGTPSYRYVWKKDNASGAVLLDETVSRNTSTLEGVNSGNYYVEVITPKGCSDSRVIHLERSPDIYITIRQTGDIVCSGDNTGELTATVTGGAAPYRYFWYQINEYTQEQTPVGSDDETLSSIPAGNYRLQIEDANGVKARSKIARQTEQNPIYVSFQTERLDCYHSSDGFLEAEVSGGIAPYAYLWENGSTSDRIENLSAGSYRVRVTDAGGCYRDAVGTVSAPGRLNVNAVLTHPACSGAATGKIQLQITGGNTPYDISWSTGSTQNTLAHLTAGMYTVTVTDGKGCESVEKTFALNEPQAIEIRQSSYQPVSAFGRTDGAFSIRISGGNSPYALICKKDETQNINPQSIQNQGDASVVVTYANLPVGNYSVTVMDKNYQSDPAYNNCSATFSIEVAEPPAMSVYLVEQHPITCYEGNDGSLLAVGDGGEPDSPLPYRYEWFLVEGYNRTPIGENSDRITGLSDGIYVVRITDKNRVSVFSAEYKLTAPAPLSLLFDSEPLNCAGGNNGQITAIVVGGAGNYIYLWNTGETSPVISGKPAGVYEVRVSDQRGCQIEGSAILEDPESMRINYHLYPQTCYAANDGAIYLNIEGGTEPYRYLWSNGLADPFLENLAPGSYGVTITDNRGCFTDTVFIIPDLEPITVRLLEQKQPIGFGYSDGSLSVEISGGNFPYAKVVWTDSKGETVTSTDWVGENQTWISILDGIPEGWYSLRIEDANYMSISEFLESDSCNCRDTLSFYMPQPPKLLVDIEKTQDILCYDHAEGTIVSTSEGGVPLEAELPYTYEWYKNGELYETGQTEISALKVGTYRLRIIDANGIDAWSDAIVLNQPDLLELRFETADVKCSRDLGWAEVFISGGTAPYTCEWSTGDTASRIENIPRGKYMVWVRDAHQCEVSGIVEIIQSGAIRISVEKTEPACFGGSDGEIHVSLSKGEPPYSYQWENGLQSLSRTGLSKGSYTFTVSDAYGCSLETLTVDLGEPDELTVDLGEDRELCTGQSHTIRAQLAEPVQSYTWFDANQKILHTGEEYTLTEAGTYTVKAVTQKGCTAYGKVTITCRDLNIASDFIIASRVPVHEDVYAVNISTPEPESVEWILPDPEGYEVISKNDRVLALVFHEYGEYTIGMSTYVGKCYETVYKTIRVMDKIDIDDYQDADEAVLRSFIVAPNPAKEQFTATVELKEETPVTLYLINTGNGKVIDRKPLSGNRVYREVFRFFDSQQGTYIVSLVSPKVKAVRKVMLH